jgi:hypothetical protein
MLYSSPLLYVYSLILSGSWSLVNPRPVICYRCGPLTNTSPHVRLRLGGVLKIILGKPHDLTVLGESTNPRHKTLSTSIETQHL